MAIYFCTFFLSVINTYIIKLKDKHNLLFYVFVLFPPVFLATVRYNIGTDYLNYWYYFQGGNYISIYEPLFCLLNYVARYVFSDFYGVLLLSALLTYGFLLATLVRLKEEVSITISLLVYYLYYYVASLNVMRQLIAVSIILFATVLLNEDKKIKFIILVIIATLFHSSAILTLIFLLLKSIQKTNSRNKLFLLFSVTVTLFFAGGYILNTLGGIFGEYSKYISNYESIVSLSYIIDIIPTFLIVAIPAICYLKHFRYTLTDRKNYDLFSIIGLFSIVVLIMGYHLSWFQRVLYYFDIMQVVIVGLNMKRIKLPQNKKMVKAITIIFYMFYFWYSSVYRGSNEGVPYQSILI